MCTAATYHHDLHNKIQMFIPHSNSFYINRSPCCIVILSDEADLTFFKENYKGQTTSKCQNPLINERGGTMKNYKAKKCRVNHTHIQSNSILCSLTAVDDESLRIYLLILGMWYLLFLCLGRSKSLQC